VFDKELNKELEKGMGYSIVVYLIDVKKKI
jgi:hypothetical protein